MNVVDRMEHVHLGVADMERSIAFYQRVFGFRVRHDEVGRGARCVHIGTDRFYVAMSEKPGIPRSAPAPSARIYHVGFTTERLGELKARLRELEVPFEEDQRVESEAVYIKDPDGHEIEVVGYVDGYVYR